MHFLPHMLFLGSVLIRIDDKLMYTTRDLGYVRLRGLRSLSFRLAMSQSRENSMLLPSGDRPLISDKSLYRSASRNIERHKTQFLQFPIF